MQKLQAETKGLVTSIANITNSPSPFSLPCLCLEAAILVKEQGFVPLCQSFLPPDYQLRNDWEVASEVVET